MTRHILHVEDDADIREIALLSLEFAGDFEVTQCASGEEALKALETLQPDILLLDVMMPGMNGVQLLANIRAIDALNSVPAIFMTARVQGTELQSLYDVGAIGVIAKPFDPVELGNEINNLIEKS